MEGQYSNSDADTGYERTATQNWCQTGTAWYLRIRWMAYFNPDQSLACPGVSHLGCIAGECHHGPCQMGSRPWCRSSDLHGDGSSTPVVWLHKQYHSIDDRYRESHSFI